MVQLINLLVLIFSCICLCLVVLTKCMTVSLTAFAGDKLYINHSTQNLCKSTKKVRFK